MLCNTSTIPMSFLMWSLYISHTFINWSIKSIQPCSPWLAHVVYNSYKKQRQRKLGVMSSSSNTKSLTHCNNSKVFSYQFQAKREAGPLSSALNGLKQLRRAPETSFICILLRWVCIRDRLRWTGFMLTSSTWASSSRAFSCQYQENLQFQLFIICSFILQFFNIDLVVRHTLS